MTAHVVLRPPEASTGGSGLGHRPPLGQECQGVVLDMVTSPLTAAL